MLKNLASGMHNIRLFDGFVDVEIKNPTHKYYMPKRGEGVLIISHRKTLLSEFGGCYKRLGFVMYDETSKLSQETRLIVCIGSVWKIDIDDWDLVIIDETQQVLLAMCKLVKRVNLVRPSTCTKKLKKLRQTRSDLSLCPQTAAIYAKCFLTHVIAFRFRSKSTDNPK